MEKARCTPTPATQTVQPADGQGRPDRFVPGKARHPITLKVDEWLARVSVGQGASPR